MEIACETIDGDVRAALDQAIFGVMEGRASVESSGIAQRAIDILRARGVDGIILGCTEIPFLLADPDSQADLINPLQMLAEAAVREVASEYRASIDHPGSRGTAIMSMR